MKDAIIALGMGGPDSRESIRSFLTNLFNDRDIIDFRAGKLLQKFIASRIISSRIDEVTANYDHMGGFSPQLGHTQALLENIQSVYKNKTGRTLDTYCGMCYWHPFIEDTIENISKKEYGNLYLFPMYPHYSSTTTGVCFKRVFKSIAQACLKVRRIIEIPYYYNDKKYNICMAEMINQAALRLGVPFKDIHILYSAHSLPRYVIQKGDPYQLQIYRHVEILNSIINPASYSIAYQSRVGKIKWLEPYLKSELERLGSVGKKHLLIVGISFVNDHIETLVELDRDAATFATSLGIETVRAQALNSDMAFACSVVDIITGVTDL